MARPTTITDEQILEAARQVFLERGPGATSAEVAERAGVSEGSIFNRFRTKAELFRQAMRPGEAVGELFDALDARVGQGSMRAQLDALALELLEHFRRIVPLMVMTWSAEPHGARAGAVSVPSFLRESDSPPLRNVKRLAAYFEAEIRRGRIRAIDPEVLARTFSGALMTHAMWELMFEGTMPLASTTYVRGVVDALWSGVAPTTPTTEEPDDSAAR